ncbi:UNVERIFIED_CONTAM: hypothetical protein RMT77_001129 [Armadillidium vulgare]
MSARNSDSDFTDNETPDVDHDDKRIKDLTTFLSSYKPKKSVNLRSRKPGSSASGSQPTLDSKFFEELIKHMNSVQKKLDEISSQLKISNEKSVKNENDIKMLKEKINDKDKKIDVLETRLDDLERRSRNNQVLLTGGNLEDSAMNDADFVKNLISTTLGIDDYYSFKVERIGKSKRVLLVHFSDVTFIPKLFKTFRYVKPQHLYLNEYLTQKNALLAKELRSIKKTHGNIHSVFSFKGKVYVKLTKDGPKKLVSNMTDVNEYKTI